MTEKPSHRAAGAQVAGATAGAIIAQQVAGKAIRDALFLSTFHVNSLLTIISAAAVLSLVGVFCTTRLLARYAPRRVLLLLFALSSAGLGADWLLYPLAPRGIAAAVYLHVAFFNPVILSVFWSLVNEHFDPHTARKAVARIGAGAALGGMVGGIAAWRMSTLVHVSTAVIYLAGVNLLCAIGVIAIPRRSSHNMQPFPVEAGDKDSWSLRRLVATPYLCNLAVLVAVGSMMSTLLDYVLSAQATAALGDGASLLAFFSLFGFSVSLLSFLFQVSLSRLAMEKVGLGVNIAVLPAIVILGGAVGLSVPGLASVAMLRGAELVQRNTLFRSAYELLYTPLQEQQKRAAKGLIDVGFDRLGTVLGSGLAMATVALFVENQRVLLGLVLLLAAATLGVARNIHNGYISALRGRLRASERGLERSPARNTLGTDEKAGDALIQRVERVRQHDDAGGPALHALAHADELAKAVLELASGEASRIRGQLSAWDDSKLPLVSFGILLLAREDVQVDARKALRSVADKATGQLLDALLDPRIDFAVRRRVPAVLAVCSTQRAADGLLLGLADERFEVRYSCVRALMKVTERGRGIVFERQKIIETIRRELDRATTVFEALDDGSDDDPDLLDLIARDRVTRSVENLFSLLSLIVERDGLRLCLQALHHENDHQRGTALEYLQAVLPAELRDQLLLLLSEAGPLPTARAPGDLLAELTRLPITWALAGNGSLEQRLSACCEALLGMGAAFARVWIYDASENMLQLRASVGLYTHIDGAHARVPLGALKIGTIAASREPHLTNNVIGDPQVPEQDWARREGLVSFAGYPLVAGGRLKGVVALFAKHELSPDMLTAMASVAETIAAGIGMYEAERAHIAPS